VHPDKNAHPGATEAMKRLNDAYQRLARGAAKTDKVLPLDKEHIAAKAEKPPKVILVKNNRYRN
jgi:hypothetical protein